MRCSSSQITAIDAAMTASSTRIGQMLGGDKKRRKERNECRSCIEQAFADDGVTAPRYWSDGRFVATLQQILRSASFDRRSALAIQCDQGGSPRTRCENVLISPDGEWPLAFYRLDAITLCNRLWGDEGDVGGLKCVLIHEMIHMIGDGGGPDQDVVENRVVRMSQCFFDDCAAYETE